MFKEQLKNDINRIAPAPELLERVALMMSEQAQKPRKSPYIAAARYAAIAAAVCLIAFGAVKLGVFGGSGKIVKLSGITGEEAVTEQEEKAVPETFSIAADTAETTAEAGAQTPRDAADGKDTADMSAPVNETAYGGDGIESGYRSPVNQQLSIIDGDFVDLIGAERFDNWYHENRFSPEYNDYTDIDRFFNLYSFIRFAGLDADTVEKTMRGINERGACFGFELFYSEEDIYILTHGTKDEITEHFAADKTVYHNGKLYTMEWFDNHTVEEYRAEGIPPEKIKEKLDNMLYLSGFYDLTGFLEKINEYIGGEAALPDADNVPHPIYANKTLEYRIKEYPREAVVTGETENVKTDRDAYGFKEEAERIARSGALSLSYIKILETLPDARTELNFANSCTVYRAEVSDLISGDFTERKVIFAGTETRQEPGSPVYQAGDELLCETEIFGGEMIIREFLLCDIYDTPAGKAAYLRISAMDIDGVKNYAEARFELVTTTLNNPAVYYGIYDYEKLSAAFVNEIRAAADRLAAAQAEPAGEPEPSPEQLREQRLIELGYDIIADESLKLESDELRDLDDQYQTYGFYVPVTDDGGYDEDEDYYYHGFSFMLDKETAYMRHYSYETGHTLYLVPEDVKAEILALYGLEEVYG